MSKIANLIIFGALLALFVKTGMSQANGVAADGSKSIVFTAQEIAKRNLPSVVLIVCDDGRDNMSQGSGFFIRSGKILTNYHVVKGMVRGKVKVAIGGSGATEWWIDKVEFFDEANDIALLSLLPNSIPEQSLKKSKSIDSDTESLSLSESDKVAIGDEVYVLSNPKGLMGTMSKGMVSGEIRRVNGVNLMQIDAPISAGSSGGAVLNTRGEVVGIAAGSLSSGQSLNFAIPVSQIKRFLIGFDLFATDKDYRLVRPSNIQNSWGKFLELRPLVGASLEETTGWIENRLKGIRFVYSDGAEESVDSLSFSKCSMSLAIKIGKADAETIIIQYYTPNVKLLRRAHAYVNKADGQNIVVLNFHSKVAEETRAYIAQGFSVTSRPIEVTQEERSMIIIRVNSFEDAELVSEGFMRLIGLCKSDN